MHTGTQYSTGNEYTHKKRARLRSPPPYNWEHQRRATKPLTLCLVCILGHTKSCITKPQNVYVMRDIMCSGYVAGGNTRWFAMEDGDMAFKTTGNSETAQAGINKRLSFEDDASGEYASMLAFACPYGEAAAASRDQVISISDRLLPWEVTKNADSAKTYFPGGATGYKTYRAKYGLNQLHFGEDVRATESMSFMSQVRTANNTCTPNTLLTTQTRWLTPMLVRAGRRQQRAVLPGPAPQVQPLRTELLRARSWAGPLRSGCYSRRCERLALRAATPLTPPRPRPSRQPTNPPLSTHLVPPQARWRRGESVSLKSARDSMVSLEVASHSQLVFGNPANMAK